MSKVLSYNFGDFIRKRYEDKIEKPKDIGMILKPKGNRKLKPEDIFDDIETRRSKQNENTK